MLYDPDITLSEDEVLKPPSIMPQRLLWRLIYGFSTLVAPWIGLAFFGFRRFGEAVWQDGNFETYAELSLAQSIWPIFLPFMLYASLAMLLLLIDPTRFAQYRLVRLGLYTAPILVLQFLLQVLVTELAGALVIATTMGIGTVAAGFLLYYGYRFAAPFLVDVPLKWKIGIGLLLLAPLLFGLYYLLFWVGFGVTALGIIGCLPITLLVAVRLMRQIELPAAHAWLTGLLGGGWLLAYGLTLSLAVNRILALYAELPTEPPQDCYVATASANGHRRLVRSTPITTPSGQTMMVSRQLQLLKGGELALKGVCPGLHRAFRSIYDALGPKLAGRMGSPWVADLGYLLLKPVEWGTYLTLRFFSPPLLRKTGELYVSQLPRTVVHK